MTRHTASHASFAQHLADQHHVAPGQAVVYLKHEGFLNPVSFFATREDFLLDERRRDCGWITVEAARKLADKRFAVLVEF
jgi:hypothetical protein